MKKSIFVLLLTVLLALTGACGVTQGTATPQPTATCDITVTPSAETAPPSEEPDSATEPSVAVTTTPAPESKPTPKLQKPVASPIPAEQPSQLESSAPAEPIHETTLSCTLWIRCDTILDNLDQLDEEKVELVPADGVVLHMEELTVEEGESVFELLLRVTRAQKIQMEFVDTPLFNSAYIEGIGNLYEFDCGALSGWSYKVNDVFPGKGCSQYQLEDGDVVEWVYTCDLGRDVGGSNGWEDGT